MVEIPVMVEMPALPDQWRRELVSGAPLAPAPLAAQGLMRFSKGASSRSAISVSCAACARSQ
jgi:hypothetical protein